MKLTLVAKLPGQIKIYHDLRNWILEVSSVNNRFYFAELDELLLDLLNLRIKTSASTAKTVKLNIRTLINAVQDARISVLQDLEEINKSMTNHDRNSTKTSLDNWHE